jgi:hypothetical protein
MVRAPKSLAVPLANWRHLVLHLKICRREQIASKPRRNKRARNGRLPYGDPGDRPPNPIFRELSLLPAKNSLFPEIFSLLICVGNFTRSRCGTAVSRNEIRF